MSRVTVKFIWFRSFVEIWTGLQKNLYESLKHPHHLTFPLLILFAFWKWVWCFSACGRGCGAIKSVKTNRDQKSWGQSQWKEAKGIPPVRTQDSGPTFLPIPGRPISSRRKLLQNWTLSFVGDPFLWNVWLTLEWRPYLIQPQKRKAGQAGCFKK